jgi:phospholipase C
MNMPRRTFLAAAAAVAAGVIVGGCGSDGNSSKADPSTSLPEPRRSRRGRGLDRPDLAPFDTVVVLMMENRSFDHFLSWVPGAEGIPKGLTYPTKDGRRAAPWPLKGNFQGCEYFDPAHDWRSMAQHLNGGAMDGFLLTQPDGDLFPISHYERGDLPVFAALSDRHTTLDHYFCSISGPTWPNRLYQLAAASDLDMTRVLADDAAPGPSRIDTTIFDRVLGAGLTAGYYSFPGAMMTHIFASRRYDHISHPFEKFLKDAEAGTLPNVVFVDPDWSITKILNGTSSDLHPPSSTRVGERLIADVYEALARGPQWDRSVFVLNFDESGGFADHVKPPRVMDNNVNPNPGPHPDYGQLGPRVPCIVGGPFAPAGVVSDGPYEHTSVLRMIEWRWGLKPLTARDAHAKNLAEVLDFAAAQTPATIGAFEVPTAKECAIKVASHG